MTTLFFVVSLAVLVGGAVLYATIMPAFAQAAGMKRSR